MPSEQNPPDGVTPNRPLPPELEFIVNVPDLREMDGDEIHAWTEEYFARIRQKAALLSECGMDAEMLIAYMEPNFRAVEQSIREIDEANEKYYQAEADMGDSQYKLFKHMDYMLKKMLETKPFDPFVEEWKEYLDEWRKHMPKE